MACVHGRHKELEMFVKQYNYLKESADKPLGLTLVCSTTEDYEYLTGKLEVPEESVHRHINEPLSRKHNLMLGRAMQSDWDGLIHLGSDDLVSREYLQKAERLDLQKPCFYALEELYFYQHKTGKIKRFASGKIGAGRVFSRELLLQETAAVKVTFQRPYYAHDRGETAYLPSALIDKVVHERKAAAIVDEGIKQSTKYILWLAKKNQGLDNESNRVLREAGYEPEVLTFNYPQLIDVKSTDSITSWERIKAKSLGHLFYKEELARISPWNFKAPEDET